MKLNHIFSGILILALLTSFSLRASELELSPLNIRVTKSECTLDGPHASLLWAAGGFSIFGGIKCLKGFSNIFWSHEAAKAQSACLALKKQNLALLSPADLAHIIKLHENARTARLKGLKTYLEGVFYMALGHIISAYATNRQTYTTKISYHLIPSYNYLYYCNHPDKLPSKQALDKLIQAN